MKKRMILVLMIVSLLLSACNANNQRYDNLEAQNEQEREIPENETQAKWALKQIELPDADMAIKDLIPEEGKGYGEYWGLAGEIIYRLIHIGSSSDNLEYAGSCVQVLRPPYTEWENYPIAAGDWEEGKSFRPWMFNWSEYLSEDGTLYLLLQEQEVASYLGRWSVEEGCSVTKLESEQMQESYFYDKYPAVWFSDDGLGNYFLYTQLVPEIEYHSFWLDVDNQEQKGMPQLSEGYIWQIAVNPFSEEVYLCGIYAEDVMIDGNNISLSDSGFSVWKAGENKTAFTTQDTNMSELDRVAFSSETEGYLWNGSGIWRFSLEKKSMEQVFDKFQKKNGGIEDFSAEMSTWHGASVRDDGSLLMLSEGTYTVYGENTYFLWELSENAEGRIVQENEEKEKKELVLAVTLATSADQQMINEFNMRSDDYRIVLRTPEEGESFDDYRTRIQAEMAGGGGPDLLMTGEAINLEAGARQRYLLDITEYFAEYEDAVLPSVWKMGQVDGRLYALPYTCGVNTLVVSRDVTGERKNWTLQEAMECMKESDATFFAGRVEEAGLFYFLGLSTGSNKELVDWEHGTSSLNSDEAVELLQFAVKYADHESNPDNVARRVSDGEGLVYVQYLNNIDTIQLVMAIFQDREAYIGFPVEDGGSGHLMRGDSVAVNQACSEKDGAVAFLRFLLSEEYQAQIAEKAVSGTVMSRPNGFPVRKEALEQFFDTLQKEDEEPEGFSAFGDFEYQAAPLSDEQIDRLREVFFTARPANAMAEDLMPIIEEEMDTYISGMKSAKQVLDIIQNRIQLYLDEMN